VADINMISVKSYILGTNITNFDLKKVGQKDKDAGFYERNYN